MGATLGSFSSLTIWGLPRVSFFAYYMGALLDMYFRIVYGGPLKSVSLPTIWRPPGQFLRILYGGPLRLVYSLTLLGPPSGQFLRLLYGGFLRSVSLLTMWGGGGRSVSLHNICSPSLRSACFFTIWGPRFCQFLRLLCGPLPQISFFADYMGALLRSVSLLTI